MNVKKHLALLYRMTSRLLFVPVCAAGVLLGGIAVSQNTSSVENNNSVSDISYTLREYEGRIGVFRDGNTIPDEILDVYMITLPDHDVARLKNGISASSQAEVRSLIEDFSG